MEKHALRLLIVSLGRFTGILAERVARSGLFAEIVLASRSLQKAQAKANNVRIGAALEGHYPSVRAVALDVSHDDAPAVLAHLSPDITFTAPSLLPWWSLKRLPGNLAHRATAVPFAGFAACHLAPMLRFREAWVASGQTRPWIAASYPDVVNHVLACTGAAPICGTGNVLEAVPKVRFVAAERLGADPDNLAVRLVAQHALEYYLYSDGVAGVPPPFLLEVQLNGVPVADERLNGLFAPMPIPYATDFNQLAASATLPVLAGLFREAPTQTHVPAPNGRLGGYPVSLSRSGIALDLADCWTEAKAESVNRASLVWDGLRDVEADGTLVFTGETRAALEALTGNGVSRLAPADAEAMAEELICVCKE